MKKTFFILAIVALFMSSCNTQRINCWTPSSFKLKKPY